MIKKYSFLNFMSSTKTMVVFIIVFILFVSIVLPFTSNLSDEIVGSQSPDTSFFYNKEDLDIIADSYGVVGRKNYIIIRWTFDLVWPIVYFLFLLSTHLWLLNKLNISFYRKLLLLPLVATSFDYIENISLSIYMLKFPDATAFMAIFSSIASALKWILLSIAFLVIVIMLFQYLFIQLKRL